MSRGADTKANAWGGGTLERGDLRLLEDRSERRGALVFDVVATETAGEWRSEDIEKAVCQGALTERQTLGGSGSSAKRPTPAIAASSCP